MLWRIKALRFWENGLLNHPVCSGHDTSFNSNSLEDNYLTVAVSTDRRLVCKYLTISWLWE